MPKLELPRIDIPRPTLPKLDLSKVRLDTTPLYAGAGAAEAALGAVRQCAAGVQKRVEGYQKDATARFAGARRSVAALEPRTLPARARATLEVTTTTAGAAYAELAQRGEVVVARLRGKPVTAPEPAATEKPTKTSSAKKATARTTAKETTAKKTTAKRTTRKSAPAAKA